MLRSVPALLCQAWAAQASALSYCPVAPCRAAHTRAGAPIRAGETRSFRVAGLCGVAAGARVFALNFAAAPLGPLGWLTA